MTVNPPLIIGIWSLLVIGCVYMIVREVNILRKIKEKHIENERREAH